MPAESATATYAHGRWKVDLRQRELLADGVPVAVGGRAFDIIEALLHSANDLVTKDELIRRVWRGAIVEENTLQVHMSAIRRALGADRALLQTSAGRGYRLLGRWVPTDEAAPGNEQSGPTPPAARTFANNLQSPRSGLIGRALAVQHLRDLLSAYRNVTLTGPGGIGKTSLALEAARALFPGFGGDIWFVELVALSDPDLVPAAVAGAIGLELGAGALSAQAVARGLGDRKALLILDNCEHLVDAAARLAETVTRLCPASSILATSRETLRIDGEYVYRVPPLDVPPAEAEAPADLLPHSAVELFLSRQASLGPEVSPDPASLRMIGAICRRLDGIPLAIELAAARTATLGPEFVLSRLDERFDLLTNGRRTAVPNHRTLRATLDWSYDLLPPAEQRLLRFLAVFPAGFTLDAAIAVMPELAAPAVMDGVGALVAKSLVALDDGGASRWRLLETTRAYAFERLAAAGEADLAARRHAGFFRDLFESGAFSNKQKPSSEELARNGREIDNVRAALDWAFSPAGDTALGVVLTAVYVPTWIHLLLMVECHGRAERALVSLESDPTLEVRLRMQLRIALVTALLHSTGAEGSLATVLANALEDADSLGDLDAQLRLLWAMWSFRFNKGEQRVAEPLAERFLRVASRDGSPAEILVGDRIMGLTAHYGGDQNKARRYLERVRNLPFATSDPRQWIWSHHDQRLLARIILARVLWLQGSIDQARVIAQSCVDDAQAIDHKLGLSYALAEAVCPIAIMTGDLDTAEASVRFLSDVVTRHGVTLWRSLTRCLEAELQIRRGDFAAGANLLGRERDNFVKTWRMTRLPEILGHLAQGLAAAGQHAEAHATINDALTRSEQAGQRWCVPELHRIRGELLLQDPADDTAAEAEFLAAIAQAGQQGALFWELRAALSLARLRVRQDRPDSARQVLVPVFDRFTEGFDATDLQHAKALLATLPKPRLRC